MVGPENSNETVISLASQPASARERRLVSVGAVFLALVPLLPFLGTPLPAFNAFVLSFVAVIFINDLIA
jgi:hypothetical protein